ncbi:MAG: hypothetical protein ABMA15_17300, partial [Vicinamibacterales bacterium]
MFDGACGEKEAVTLMMPAGPRALDPLFQPEVVAVIGASRTRGGIGSEIFHNIQSAGYRGRVI